MRLGLSSGLSTGGFVPSFTNAYSVSFDGSDDHATTSADDTLATKTYSFWAKSSDTTHNTKNAVFDHGGINRGAFYLNWNNSRPLIYLNTTAYRYFNDVSAQDDGNWHHWVVLIDSDITATKLFCDGSEVSVISTTSTGSGLSYLTGIRIGRGDFYYFDGNLDEFAIFDGDKTGIVSTLYNDGVPSDLTGLSGLEHWWRMGDGTAPVADGSGWNTNDKFVFDQIGTSLGSEMVIADAYTTDEWYVYSGNTMTFGDNFMRCERTESGSSNGWFTYLRSSSEANSILTSTPTTDSFYLLTFDVETDDADAYVFVKINNTSSYYLQGTGNGTKTIVYKKNSYIDYIEGRSLSQGKFMKISNVSVKQINGATAALTNGAAIQADAP